MRPATKTNPVHADIGPGSPSALGWAGDHAEDLASTVDPTAPINSATLEGRSTSKPTGHGGPAPSPTPSPTPSPSPGPSPTPIPTAPTSGVYTFEGAKWSSSTITWSFAQSTLAQDTSTPFSSAVGSAYQSTIEQALQRWASVTGLTFVQQSDSSSADIRIGFANLNTPSTGTVGNTTYHYSGTSLLPDVVVQLEDPAQLGLSATSAGLQYNGLPATLLQVATHELGHALGLGHSTDQSAVMNAYLEGGNQTLDANDVGGIQALYGVPSSSTVGSVVLLNSTATV